MNTITFTSGTSFNFNINEVIQENDINNVIIAYNNSLSTPTNYSINDVDSINLISIIYEIGINAFSNFINMQTITLSPTINKINITAFYGCSLLLSITLPNTLTFLGSKSFYSCSSLATIILYNTANLICIGDDVFNNIGNTGSYTFDSYNNLNTPTISKLISLLPSSWTRSPDSSYNIYVDFAILNDKCLTEKCIENKNYYFDLSCVPIPYKDFHTLFFNNNVFSLNYKIIYQPTIIIPQTLENYITLNTQVDVCGNKFNLTSTLDSLYECSMPKKCWSVESLIYFNKHISKLKTILNFNIDTKLTICRKDYIKNDCNKNDCNKNDCNKCDYCNKNDCNKCDYCNKNDCNKNDCNKNDDCKKKNKQICDMIYNKNNMQKIYTRGSTITIDDFFNMYEAQGVEMAVDNSYNSSIPSLCQARGLPINAATIKYVAILNLFVKSMYNSVDNLNIRFPYLIDFSGSMPTSPTDNNNYRYNP